MVEDSRAAGSTTNLHYYLLCKHKHSQRTHCLSESINRCGSACRHKQNDGWIDVLRIRHRGGCSIERAVNTTAIRREDRHFSKFTRFEATNCIKHASSSCGPSCLVVRTGIDNRFRKGSANCRLQAITTLGNHIVTQGSGSLLDGELLFIIPAVATCHDHFAVRSFKTLAGTAAHANVDPASSVEVGVVVAAAAAVVVAVAAVATSAKLTKVALGSIFRNEGSTKVSRFQGASLVLKKLVRRGAACETKNPVFK
jgi:hypothetical protein